MLFFKRRPKVVPATELLTNFDGYRLKRGGSYLVKEPKPERSFEIFTNMVKGVCAECPQTEAFPCESIVCMECTLSCPCKHCKYTRAQGLCFATDQPEGLMQRYLLQTTPVFWISKHGKGSINPANIEIMAGMINEFFRTSKNPVVLLDGIEYIIITNGFIPVLKFLHDLREWAILHNAILILPLNPATLDEKELALIERNMHPIDFSSKAFENYNIIQR
ncbi:MAG: DUF835 domain-containing protein [Candidatus Methanoperedens sp.]|nr:DUF835 domain-containing protein [Candidatus Methanoperedens sp.]